MITSRLIVLILLLFHLTDVHASTVIDLQILNGSNTQIQVYEPVDGKFTQINSYYVNTDIEGKLTIAPDIQKAGFVYIFLPYLTQSEWSGIHLYIEPNSYLQVTFDRANPLQTLQFSGTSAKENQLLQSFKRSAPFLSDNSAIFNPISSLESARFD